MACSIQSDSLSQLTPLTNMPDPAASVATEGIFGRRQSPGSPRTECERPWRRLQTVAFWECFNSLYGNALSDESPSTETSQRRPSATSRVGKLVMHKYRSSARKMDAHNTKQSTGVKGGHVHQSGRSRNHGRHH